MSTLFADRPCADPHALYRACLDTSPPLPTDWHGGEHGPNIFKVPLGRGPGTGRILLTLGDLSAIDQTAAHDLTFLDDRGNERTLKKVTLLRAMCLTPGWEGDEQAHYLCEVVDRRYFLARVPIDKGYNIAAADGASYLTSSQNAGSPWTWQTLVQDLWTALGLGTAPTLPVTFASDPENLTFFAAFAWEALHQVLDWLGCTTKYDPEADTFTILKLGDTTAAAATTAAAGLAAMDRAGLRTWDGYWVEPARGRLPEKVRVVFPRRPQPTDGTSIFYTADVTLTPAVAGVEPGTIEQLHDGLTAVGTGTPTNASSLSARAAERAASWRLKRVFGEARQTLVYRDFQNLPGLLCETTRVVLYDDRGGPMRTEVMSRPDGLMEKFRPYEQPLVLENGSTSAARQPRAGKLTEATGPATIQPRVLTAGVWGNDGSTLADEGYAVELEGAAFTPKPTANVIFVNDPASSSTQFFVLPVQTADKVSGTYYAGYVSTGAQTFGGDKTFHGKVVVGDQATAGQVTVWGASSSDRVILTSAEMVWIHTHFNFTIAGSDTFSWLPADSVALVNNTNSAGIAFVGSNTFPSIMLGSVTGGLVVTGVSGTFSNGTSTLHFTNGLLTSITTP